MGYTLCPHVAYDLHYIECEQDDCKNPCTFRATGIPECVWLKKRELGKCHFCLLEDSDAKRKMRRLRKLDFFSDDLENVSPIDDTLEESR
jgi:hypothetical protein